MCLITVRIIIFLEVTHSGHVFHVPTMANKQHHIWLLVWRLLCTSMFMFIFIVQQYKFHMEDMLILWIWDGTCCIAFLDGVCNTMLLNLLRSHKDLKKGRDIPIIYTAASVVMPRVVNNGVISSVSSNLPCVQCPWVSMQTLWQFAR